MVNDMDNGWFFTEHILDGGISDVGEISYLLWVLLPIM